MYNFTPAKRGEPIDITMLGKMSEYIVSINEQLLSNRSAKSSIWSPVRSQIETPDLTIWTGKVLIAEGTIPKADAERVNWSATFDIPFKSTPIVTATPYCDTTGGGTIAPSTIWIHEITPTGVKGKWKWLGTTTKVETVYALVIAVGEGVVA